MSWLVSNQSWYVFCGGKQYGPLSPREILYLVANKKLSPDTLVWRPGFPSWQRAEDVKGLFKPPPLSGKQEVLTFDRKPRPLAWRVAAMIKALDQQTASNEDFLQERNVAGAEGRQATTRNDPSEEGSMAKAGELQECAPAPDRALAQSVAAMQPVSHAGPGHGENISGNNSVFAVQPEHRPGSPSDLFPDATIKSFFWRYWLGNFGLTGSMWLNAALLMALLIVSFSAEFLFSSSERRIKDITLIAAFLGFIPVLVWTLVGLWRSAAQHRSRGNLAFGPRLAQISVVLTMFIAGGVFLAGLLPDAIPSLRGLDRSAFVSALVPDRRVPSSGDAPSGAPRAGRDRGTSVSPAPREGKVQDVEPDTVPLPSPSQTLPVMPEPAEMPSAKQIPFGNRPGETTARVVATGEPSDVAESSVGDDIVGRSAPLLDEVESKIKPIRDMASLSMVRIVAYGESNTPEAVGMGFYFKRNLIATNLHVVRRAKFIAVEGLFETRATRAVRIKAYSSKFNIAILETGRDATPLKLSAKIIKKVGDEVIIFGHPKWSERATATGTISVVDSVGGSRTYKMTAPVSPGRSGGPVFDKQGDLFGIATHAIKDSRSVNLVMPVSILESLAKKQMKWKPQAEREDEAGVATAIGLTHYSKEAGAKEEFISLQNLTNSAVENVIFSVTYRDDSNKVFYSRLLRMKGPIQPGSTNMGEYQTPKVAWPRVWRGQSEEQESSFSVDIRPLDYEIVTTGILESRTGN